MGCVRSATITTDDNSTLTHELIITSTNVHRAAATNSLPTTSSERKCRVDGILDFDQRVKNHRTALVEVESVGLHVRLDLRGFGVPSVYLEGFREWF